MIMDNLAATTAGAVTSESFTTLVGPTYGTVYRGVAHVDCSSFAPGHIGWAPAGSGTRNALSTKETSE